MVGTADGGNAVTVPTRAKASRGVLSSKVVMLVAAASLTIACSGDPSSALSETLRLRATELVLEAEQRGDLTVVGRDGWLFFAPELRHLSAISYWGQTAGGGVTGPRPECRRPPTGHPRLQTAARPAEHRAAARASPPQECHLSRPPSGRAIARDANPKTRRGRRRLLRGLARQRCRGARPHRDPSR